jgi:hypothetical protein
VSATANVVIIAAIVTKIGPSTHDERHQAALDLVPRSLVAAITFSMLMSLSARPAAIAGVTRRVLWMRSMEWACPLLQGRAWPGRKTHGAHWPSHR